MRALLGCVVALNAACDCVMHKSNIACCLQRGAMAPERIEFERHPLTSPFPAAACVCHRK